MGSPSLRRRRGRVRAREEPVDHRAKLGGRKRTAEKITHLRAQQLDLRCPRDTTRVCIEVAAYLSALVTNHLHTGRFKRTV